MYIYIILLVVAVTIIYSLYKIMKGREFKIKGDKTPVKGSVVFITKNSENILKYSINRVLKLGDNLYEIIVLDYGSIDKTLDVAHELLDDYPNSKIVDLNNNTIHENYYEIIKRYVGGDTVTILDLYKIVENNPNLYVPELFKPINSIIEKKLPKIDTRIDGTKFLYFDQIEREKNEYVIKEHVLEVLSNVSMRMELSSKEAESDKDEVKDKTKDMIDYLNSSGKNIALLTKLLGPVNFIEEDLNDNLLSLFSDYSQNYDVSVNYKVLGLVKKLKKRVKQVILNNIQDLLYTIVIYNLATSIDVSALYRRKHLQIILKFEGIDDKETLISKDSGLSYYILKSIQNRLSLLCGSLKIKIDGDKRAKISMKIPLNEITLLNEEVNNDEK